MSNSPSSLTLAKLRKDGFHAQVVEKTIPRTFIKKDLFGAIDIVAVDGVTQGVLGIQCTSRNNSQARFSKAVAIPEILAWLKSGNRMEVWGWSKMGARGKRKLWSVHILVITAEDFDGHSPVP